MEKTKAAIVGLAAVVAALVLFSGAVYATGGQFMNSRTQSGNMLPGSSYGGSMMGGFGYPSGMMSGPGGMMGGRGSMMGGYSAQMMGSNGTGYQCHEYMEQYYNSTSP